MDELRMAVTRAIAHGHALPKIKTRMPVNMCPDDDPPGERPMEDVWATDGTGQVQLVLDAVRPFLRNEV